MVGVPTRRSKQEDAWCFAKKIMRTQAHMWYKLSLRLRERKIKPSIVRPRSNISQRHLAGRSAAWRHSVRRGSLERHWIRRLRMKKKMGKFFCCCFGGGGRRRGWNSKLEWKPSTKTGIRWKADMMNKITVTSIDLLSSSRSIDAMILKSVSFYLRMREAGRLKKRPQKTDVCSWPCHYLDLVVRDR